jgi:polyphosphate kinase
MLLSWAARDPDVVAIKQILSSVSGPLVQKLVDAAEAGKDVVVVLTGEHHDSQLATRGNDELAGAGVLVIRPFTGSFLPHRETTLVVRREPGRLRTYVAHLRAIDGQGVVSTDATLTDRVGRLFNELTGGNARAGEALS